MISKMKIELGAQFVAKFVQMGTDMKNSKESTEAFKKQAHRGEVAGVEMTAKV